MVHGTLFSVGPMAPLGVGTEYDLEHVRRFINDGHVNTFITRLNVGAESFAKQNNEVQALAESARWGILTVTQRFAKTINAGVDQIGGTEQSSVIAEDVRDGSIAEVRVREAAGQILLQKFQLGLFERPYVDETKAASIAGSEEFVRQGQAAQARAVVLLENKPVASAGKPLLPIAPSGKKVYLFGSKVAEAAGFAVVLDPAQADLAIIRAPAPYGSEHPNFFFGSRQHEGRLSFTEKDAAYAELLRVSPKIATVFLTTLERPLILTNVRPCATALLGDFGISDEALFTLITGKISPGGRLPFELPSSIEAVSQQKSDLPHDSRSPLFPIGFGLQYLGQK